MNFFILGVGRWPLYCSGSNYMLYFLPKAVSTRAQTENDKPNRLTQAPAEELRTQNPMLKAILKVIWIPVPHITRKKLRPRVVSPFPSVFFLPNYSTSLKSWCLIWKRKELEGYERKGRFLSGRDFLLGLFFVTRDGRSRKKLQGSKFQSSRRI